MKVSSRVIRSWFLVLLLRPLGLDLSCIESLQQVIDSPKLFELLEDRVLTRELNLEQALGLSLPVSSTIISKRVT